MDIFPFNMGGIPENSIVIRRHNDIVKDLMRLCGPIYVLGATEIR